MKTMKHFAAALVVAALSIPVMAADFDGSQGFDRMLEDHGPAMRAAQDVSWAQKIASEQGRDGGLAFGADATMAGYIHLLAADFARAVAASNDPLHRSFARMLEDDGKDIQAMLEAKAAREIAARFGVSPAPLTPSVAMTADGKARQ